MQKQVRIHYSVIFNLSTYTISTYPHILSLTPQTRGLGNGCLLLVVLCVVLPFALLIGAWVAFNSLSIQFRVISVSIMHCHIKFYISLQLPPNIALYIGHNKSYGICIYRITLEYLLVLEQYM